MRYWRAIRQPRTGTDSAVAERFPQRYWFVNVVVFVGLAVPALLVATSGWPLRVGAAASLVGACVWEGVALRLRRFPLWADVLETLAVFLLAWRHPTGSGGFVFVLVFALLALGFRTIYSTPVQSAVRALSVVAAIYVGF